MTGVVVALAALLVAGSAALSAGETAVFSLGESRLRTIRQEGFQRGEVLARLRGQPGRLHASVTTLNTVFNLGAVALLVYGAALRWSATGTLLAMAGSVVVVFLLGEIVPRAIVSRRPVRLALAAAPLLARVERLARPLVGNLVRLEELLSWRNGEETSSQELEVREISELGRREGVVGEEEHLLVERAFRLDELSAWDAMTPRVDIFAWEDARPLSDIMEDLDRVPFSRVPVYGDSIDDVTGILYVRAAYETYVSGRTDLPLSRVAREPFFVPGSLPLTRLLRDFQARRIHMGIVADEFGGTDGLITLEDVLEELVGEIVDETDVAEEPITRISRTELVADGAVDLREINYAFNVSLPQLEHRSLNGFILEEMGHVPEAGETLERAGVEIEVLEASETQVMRARLRKRPAPHDAV